MAGIKRAATSGLTKPGTAIPDVPDAPTIGTATDVGTSRAYNNGAATVTYTAAVTGGAVTTFTATSTPGSFTATGSSPLTVTGLTAGTSYTFAVSAANATGTLSSAATNSITATTVPQAPTIGTATTGLLQATVAFTPGATGGKTVTTYTATSSPGSITGTGSSSPITVTGLTGGTSYTFTVTATNANGTSTASAASNSVTIQEPKAGYALSGTGSNGVIQTTDKLNFNNDTFSTLSSEVSYSGNMAFANSGTAGYATGGGFPGGRNASVNKRTYSTDALASTNSFTTGSSGGWAIGNRGSHGYIAGGDTYSSGYLSRIERMAFSNDAVSSSTALPSGRAYAAGGGWYNTGTAGYMSGGYDSGVPGFVATITKLTFSTHGTSNLSATLSGTNYGNPHISNSGTNGYGVSYIKDGSFSSTGDKFTFSNDTRSSTFSFPSVVGYGAGLSNKGNAGYTAGGRNSSAYISTAYKIAFSNDATSTVSATLSQTRGRLSGHSNEGTSL